MGFDLSKYETVEDRLARFWADHPSGRVATNIYFYDDTRVVFRAEVYFDAGQDMYPAGVGHAEEIRGATPVNKTSHVENGETSAIGRALANCNYAPKGARPSREEMQKVVTQETQTTQPSTKIPQQTASPAQIGKLSALLMGMNIDREKRLQFVSTAIGREIANLNDLTKIEASKLIGDLV